MLPSQLKVQLAQAEPCSHTFLVPDQRHPLLPMAESPDAWPPSPPVPALLACLFRLFGAFQRHGFSQLLQAQSFWL